MDHWMLVLSLFLGTLMVGGCTPVAFYQKGNLVNPIMAFDDNPTETHFKQKVFYSREGSAGGIGTGAGGGCGCY